MFYSFGYFEPVECFENRNDVLVFDNFSSSMVKSILHNLRWVILVMPMFRKRELQ